MTSQARLQQFKQELHGARRALVEHPVYGAIESLEDLQVFMQHHVLAVWDFMSLLKALQRELTCVELPWVPKGDPVTRRLINEIVLAEESDDLPEGAASHFEMYLSAMRTAGADTRPVGELLRHLGSGATVPAALRSAGVPTPAAAFVQCTWQIVSGGSLPAIAAAFTFGREELIPDMFRSLMLDLRSKFPERVELFCSYLERHIDLDEQTHTPLAERMFVAVCGDDDANWQAATVSARAALAARMELWNGVYAALRSQKASKLSA